MRQLIVVLCLTLANSMALRAETITQWDFNTGNTTPSTGSGMVTTVGGVTNPSFNSGSGSSDPTQPGSAYQTSTYPAQGENSGTAGIQIDVDTTGFDNIVCSFDLRTSNTSSRWYQIQYTTDGTNFLDFGSPVRLERFNANEPPDEIGTGDFFSNELTADLSSISGVSNNPNFAFRVVSVFSPVAFTQFSNGAEFGPNEAYEAARNRPASLGANSAYLGTGTWRFDMVTVSGTAIGSGSASVVNQYVFYSIWAGSGSDVDSTKNVYKQTAAPTSLSFDNLINAAQGITGVGFDIAGLDNAANLSQDDFEIRVSPTGSFDTEIHPPTEWVLGPTPDLSVIDGEIVEVRLSWSSAVSAKNRWLRVAIKANANTGLAAEEVFYVGHLLGETTGLTGSSFSVTFADITPIRTAVGSSVNAGSVEDIDKSGSVSFGDISAMRGNVGTVLSNIMVP